MNRNKLGIAADLAEPAQVESVLELIRTDVDVIIHNLRPGSMDRLGLGAARLRTLKPSLIYCNVGAFGSHGPLADRPGYDPLMQAFTGLMSTLGEEGRPPVRVSVSLVDMTTGMWAAIGILAALTERARTGHGAVIDTSLCEAALALMAAPIAGYLASGGEPRRLGSAHSTIVPTQAFATADGYLMVAAGNDRQFASLMATLGLEDLGRDPRFSTNAGRVQHRNILVPAIESALASAPADYWAGVLDAAQVPNAPLHSVRDVVGHPQVAALGMVQGGTTGPATVGLPLTIDEKRPPLVRDAPVLGQHTDDVLARLVGSAAG